jgi:drug/metabolite transporter (DMT)-like permease
MAWFWVALTCALSLALADSFTKKFFSHFSGLSILLIRLGLPGLVLLPYSVMVGPPDVSADFWYLILILIPLEILAMWLYVLSIRDTPLHLSLPYFAFTPVFVILTGYMFLGERVSWDGALGIALIVAGTYLLNIEHVNYSWANLFAPFSAVLRTRGSVLMLVAALIYSFTAVLSKKAMLYTDPESFGALYFSLIGIVTLLIIVAIQPSVLKKVFEKPGAISLVSLLMAVMVVTHFIALSQVETAYMLSVKRTSMIFGMLLGAWMFRDMSFKQHLPAGLVMLLGVIMILN